MRRVYALTYEYSYPNNLKGTVSPDDAGGILGLYEDEDDALEALNTAVESGDWGEWSDEGDEGDNHGWSDEGFILAVQAQDVTPSSKR